MGIKLQAFLGWLGNYGHILRFHRITILQNDRARLAVTKRKISGGSRSMERFKHTAHLLTVVQTCRFQGRSVIDFFEKARVAVSEAAPEATAGHSTSPSLIPKSNS